MSEDPIASETKRRWLLAVASCGIVALPYLVVTFPPTTDLPQHVAQVRLFADVWLRHEDAYRIHLNTPYALGYVLIALYYYLAGPLAAGRLALMTVAVAWAASIHYLAARRNLPVAGAVLATVFVFNHTFYWGLFSFVFGFPFFVLWLLLTTEPDRSDYGARDGLKLLGTGLLLFYSHAFWFAAGLVWLAVSICLQRPRRRTVAWRIGSVTPVVALAAVWYLRFSATWYANAGVWNRWPWNVKLDPMWWVCSALGGIEGSAEPVILGLVVVWIATAVVVHRKTLTTCVNLQLACCALIFLVMALVAPYSYQHTIFFAERWLPLAFMFGVLAVPSPFRKSRLDAAGALATLAVFGLSTALLWWQFDATETTGLEPALEAVPVNARVIGLNYINLSALVRNDPFMQMAAYAQAMKGARLNFSFAEYPQSPVVYNQSERFKPPWTARLEWFPDLVKPSDFEYFDYALINTDDGEHRHLPEKFPVAPVTTEGRWRLYKVTVVH